MKLLLQSVELGPKATIGRLFENGVAFSYTLEDHYPVPYKKTPKKTAIPADTYVIDMNTVSPRYGRIMPRLYNFRAPDGRLRIKCPDGSFFDGVLIHPLNGPEETDGCIGVGFARVNPTRIEKSRLAFDSLMVKLEAAKARGEKITIEVRR